MQLGLAALPLLHQRRQQKMQKQREGSSEEATLWSGIDGGADGYGEKEKKRPVAPLFFPPFSGGLPRVNTRVFFSALFRRAAQG